MLRRIRLILSISLLLCLAFLAGCSPPGPKFSQPISPVDGKAIIYVYRVRFALTSDSMPGVKMNDEVIVSTFPDLSYFPIAVDPGHYTFTPQLFGIYGTTPGELTVEAGKTYFVWMRMEIGHIGFYQQTDAAEAMNYMSTCYLINPGFAKDSRVLTGSGSTAKTEAPAEAETPPETPAAPVSAEIPAAPTPVATVETSPTKQVEAEPVVSQTQLFVEPQPADATIRIMNIKPAFEQGIILAPGRYKIDVSATGYQSHTEWINLAKGEIRTMQVALESDQPVPATVVPTPEPAPAVTTVPAASPPAAPVAKNQPLKVPGNLSAEEKNCAKLLQSDSAIDLRNGAKSVYYRHLDNAYLTDLAAQVLLEKYNDDTRDRDHMDAMAWLCKALGKTGNSKYREPLETVADQAKNRKLRGYASKNLRYL